MLSDTQKRRIKLLEDSIFNNSLARDNHQIESNKIIQTINLIESNIKKDTQELANILENVPNFSSDTNKYSWITSNTLEIIDTDIVPSEYINQKTKTTYTVDKNKVKKILTESTEEDFSIPGVELKTNKHLQIKSL